MDYETKSEVIITKAQTRDEFLQLLIDNLTTYAIYLDKNEKKLFFNILDRMNYQGIVIMGTSFKSCVMGYMSKSSFYRSLKGLLEKEVIYEFNDKLAKKFNIGSYFKNFFLVNPILIGKGCFFDIKNLKHTVITEYDFKNLEVKKQFIEEGKYTDYE